MIGERRSGRSLAGRDGPGAGVAGVGAQLGPQLQRVGGGELAAGADAHVGGGLAVDGVLALGPEQPGGGAVVGHHQGVVVGELPSGLGDQGVAGRGGAADHDGDGARHAVGSRDGLQAQGDGHVVEVGAEPGEDGVGPLPELGAIEEGGETGEGQGREAVGGGLGPREARHAAHDEVGLVVAGGVQAAALRGEEGVEGLAQAARRLEPGRVVACLVQVDEAEEQRGVVVGEAGDVGATVLECAHQPPVDADLVEEEAGAGGRGVDPRGLAELGAGDGQGPHDQAIPRGHDLVVAGGGLAAAPHPEQARQAALDQGPLATVEAVHRALEAQYAAAILEAALHGDPEQGGEPLGVGGVEDVGQLGGRPRVEQALGHGAVGALGVGVEAGGEAPVLEAHVLQEPADGVADHRLEAGGAGQVVGLGVRHQQLGAVVQHLLEVGDPPDLVDAVAGEAAAEEVVHAALGDAVQGEEEGVEAGLVAPGAAVGVERRQGAVGRELGGAYEAAVDLVETLKHALHHGGEPAGWGVGVGVGEAGDVGQHAADPAGELVDLVGPIGPHRRHPAEDVVEARRAVAGGGGVVGATEEGLALGGEEHGHRPAAAAVLEGLDGLHVQLVDVGALLAVDLDAHEVLVHGRGDAFVLEGLPLHHVAPVARAVAHRQEDGLALCVGALQGLRTPGVPVDRVVGVLQQVWAGLVRQAVRQRAPSCAAMRREGGR